MWTAVAILCWAVVVQVGAASVLTLIAPPAAAQPPPPPDAPGAVNFSTPGGYLWSVPSGVTQVVIDARGAQGGTNAAVPGGEGGEASGSFSLSAGETLDVFVGGTNGAGGGGVADFGNVNGGGASSVAAGSTPLVVGAGGGGTGIAIVSGVDYPGGAGGAGGGMVGSAGGPENGMTGGGGGTQSAGGAGGMAQSGSGGCSIPANGTAGAAGQGGGGASSHFGSQYSGGGGGGGYYGGGGGGVCYFSDGSGGGGGSSYLAPTSTGAYGFVGDSQGNGLVSISWGFLPAGGPVAKTTLMRADKATKIKTCSCSDPVNTATGNLAETFDDLSVPGRGIPLNFSHSYNSLLESVNGPLGYGWTDPYTMSLSIGTSTTVVNQEDGTQLFYTLSGTSWTAPPWVQATLVQNGDGTWTFTRQGTEVFDFNSSGQLIDEKDRNGYATTMTYTAGQLSTVTDPAGRTLSIGWSGGHIVSVADTAAPPRSVSFEYNDAYGDLTDVIDANGGHTVFSYDSYHDLLTIRSPEFYGVSGITPPPVTTNYFNGHGQVTEQVDPLGNATGFVYTPTSTTITDPNGDTEQQVFSSGIMYSDTTGFATASAATTCYQYDPVSLATTEIIDPNDNTTANRVDVTGDVLSSTDAMGRTTTSTYNALQEPLAVVDPQGVTTTDSYDGAGNLRTSSTPLLNAAGQVVATATTQYRYGDAAHPGDITSVVDPDGHGVTYTYDSYGDVASATDALGDETTYVHDGVGRLSSEVSADGNAPGANPSNYTTHYSYNAFGQVLTEVDPLGHTQVQDQYDANGNLVTATDADADTTVSSYNADNEPVAVHRADGSAVSYGYDGDGNQVTATDAGANLATSTFTDPALPAKVTSVTDALGNVTSYLYDGDANLRMLQQPGGNCSSRPRTGCISYGYDADNEQTSISYSDGATPNVNEGYSADGQRVTMTDGTGASAWSYDSLGQLTQATSGAGAVVGYGYDLAGNETSIAYPGGVGSVTQTFNAAGRLSDVTDWQGLATGFNYDPSGNLATEVYPNETTATVTSNDANQVTGIADTSTTSPSTPFISFSYGRDNLGQETSVTSTGVPADNHSYSYTQLNQLQDVGSAATAYGYSSDNLSTLANGATQTFNADDELTSTIPPNSTVAAGVSSSAALGPDGTLWQWGQTPTGTATTPIRVSGIPAAVALTAGTADDLAVTSNGAVWGWGNDSYGELCNGTTSSAAVTASAGVGPASANVKAVASGDLDSFLLSVTGTVYGCGWNSFGELGNGTTTNSSTPVPVSFPTGTVVTQVAAGMLFTLALDSTGKVWAWGYNAYGQFGNGTQTSSLVPVQVSIPTATTIAAIAAGEYSGFALTSAHTVLGWGLGADGELGNGAGAGELTPVTVSAPATNVRAIAASSSAIDCLALLSNGTVVGWGWNAYGQIGDGTTTSALAPVAVALPTGVSVTSIAVGWGHSLAIEANGSMLSWGWNGYGQLGNATTTSSLTPGAALLPTNTATSYGYDTRGNRTSITGPAGTTTLGYDQANRLTGYGTTTTATTATACAWPRR